MTSRSYFGKMNSTLGSVVPLAMFLLTGRQILFSKICQLMKQLFHVPNIILDAVDDDGDYAGDDADDNYDGDANLDYDQDYEF